MRTYNNISTGQWTIMLPDDWRQKPGESPTGRAFYFEAADESKGAYISTWGRKDPATSVDELAAYREGEVGRLHDMPDHRWEILVQGEKEQDGIALSFADCLERGREYRIVCLGLTRFPWLVRVSLHDYACSDYAASQEWFQPIINSLAACPIPAE